MAQTSLYLGCLGPDAAALCQAVATVAIPPNTPGHPTLQDVTFGKVVEIKDLEHLDSLVDKAGNSLVVVCFYTRSCGACKALLQEFQHLCEEAKAQQVRAVFARHNLLDEFDSWSDLSVWHKIRAVPTIMFYDVGAVVKKVTLHDVRRMGEAAPTVS
eukprot:GHUV01039086.1.p1 GENE.GHUV01039086.1~~GHUV01039086.1.p1  ORF type:complete len:157 (-),score=24.51 GHUV01039086.1:749-1219(-)